MLSYEETRYLKRILSKIIKLFVILGLLVFLTYSCNWDFSLREKYLPKNETAYPEEIVRIPIQKQNVVYNKELGLDVVGQIRVTGSLVGANSDIIRTNCPFQKERVELYNKYFQAIIVSVKKKNQSFAAIPQNRLIKQLLSKLSDDESFLRSKLEHKVTLFGYTLKLREYPDIQIDHIVITKIILDDKVYE